MQLFRHITIKLPDLGLNQNSSIKGVFCQTWTKMDYIRQLQKYDRMLHVRAKSERGLSHSKRFAKYLSKLVEPLASRSVWSAKVLFRFWILRA